MSDTLVCHDNHLDRKVVVKSLKTGIEPYRLLDELSALSAIRSKYVVQVYDVIADDGGNITGFVEEYIEGPDLQPLSNSSSQDALRAIYSIAAGIADIHDHGRVHRDIKPENMKYDGDGNLKIIDFGLSKIASSAFTTQLFFSKGYTPPEAFRQDAHGNFNFTPAVDVFAFGATVWWLLNDGALPTDFMSIPPALPCSEADFSSAKVSLPPAIVPMMNACFSENAADRPSMPQIRDAVAQELLRDRHRMLITHGGQTYHLSAANRTVRLAAQESVIEITYTGLAFVVSAVSGTVMINNRPAIVGLELAGASVIVMGTDLPHQRRRVSITADISHPEVKL